MLSSCKEQYSEKRGQNTGALRQEKDSAAATVSHSCIGRTEPASSYVRVGFSIC